MKLLTCLKLINPSTISMEFNRQRRYGHSNSKTDLPVEQGVQKKAHPMPPGYQWAAFNIENHLPERAENLHHLMKKIRDGRYRIQSDRIAQKILEDFLCDFLNQNFKKPR